MIADLLSTCQFGGITCLVKIQRAGHLMARYLWVCHVRMLSEKQRDIPSQLSQRNDLIKLVVLYGPRK